MIKTCLQCGVDYAADHKRRRYCGLACYGASKVGKPIVGSWKPGSVPWNKNLKGIRLSPHSEFKAGHSLNDPAPLGAVRIRCRNGRKEGPRAWVKIAQPNKWRLRAQIEWERVNGPLQDGLVIHHRDRDSLNDDPSNLVALTRSEHAREHHAEMIESAARALGLWDGAA
jgi:hypothetical protein